ncbi:MAG: Kazal-type serine protease inhibitor [Patescibacteria group bacterium]
MNIRHSHVPIHPFLSLVTLTLLLLSSLGFRSPTVYSAPYQDTSTRVHQVRASSRDTFRSAYTPDPGRGYSVMKASIVSESPSTKESTGGYSTEENTKSKESSPEKILKKITVLPTELSSQEGNIIYLRDGRVLVYGRKATVGAKAASLLYPETGEESISFSRSLGRITVGSVSPDEELALFSEARSVQEVSGGPIIEYTEMEAYDLNSGEMHSFRIAGLRHYLDTANAFSSQGGFIDTAVDDEGFVYVLREEGNLWAMTPPRYFLDRYARNGSLLQSLSLPLGHPNESFGHISFQDDSVLVFGHGDHSYEMSEVLLRYFSVTEAGLAPLSQINLPLDPGVNVSELQAIRRSPLLAVHDVNSSPNGVSSLIRLSEDQTATVEATWTSFPGYLRAPEISHEDPKGHILSFFVSDVHNGQRAPHTHVLNVFDTDTGASESYDFRSVLEAMGVGSPANRFVYTLGFSVNPENREFALIATVHEGGNTPANFLVSGPLDALYKLLPGTERCDTDGEHPVCGADGQTYSNACFAKQAGTDIAHEGMCPVVEKEPPEGYDYCAAQTSAGGTVQLAGPSTDVYSPYQRSSPESGDFLGEFIVNLACTVNPKRIAEEYGATVSFSYPNMSQNLHLWQTTEGSVADPEAWAAALRSDKRVLDAYPVYQARMRTDDGGGDRTGEGKKKIIPIEAEPEPEPILTRPVEGSPEIGNGFEPIDDAGEVKIISPVTKEPAPEPVLDSVPAEEPAVDAGLDPAPVSSDPVLSTEPVLPEPVLAE